MPVKIPLAGSITREEFEILNRANAIEARERHTPREMVLYACVSCLTRIWLPRGSSEICPECKKGLMLLDAPMKAPGWVRG